MLLMRCCSRPRKALVSYQPGRRAPAATRQILWSVAELGGGLAAGDVRISIGEPGAKAQVAAIFFPRESQHVDLVSTVEHLAGEATSETLVKSAAIGRGQARFLGNIRIAPHAQGSDARLRDDALLLSPKAHIDSVPALEIGANDVKAYHGATVGAIDAEQIFYMESRGIEPQRGGAHDRTWFLRARDRAVPLVEPSRRNPRCVSGEALMTQTLARRSPPRQAQDDKAKRARLLPIFRSSRVRPRAGSASCTSTRRQPRKSRSVVIDALVEYYEQYNANIHRGVYEIAARATGGFEHARVKARALHRGGHSAEIIWARNTTEAINLVSLFLGRLQNLKPGDAILTDANSNTIPISCRGSS